MKLNDVQMRSIHREIERLAWTQFGFQLEKGIQEDFEKAVNDGEQMMKITDIFRAIFCSDDEE